MAKQKIAGMLVLAAPSLPRWVEVDQRTWRRGLICRDPPGCRGGGYGMTMGV